MSILKINHAYCDTIREAEKAILGYIVTLHGCNGIIDSNKLPQNDLLSALKIGYQYSNTHIDLLKKWFSNNSQVLSSLQNGNWYPVTATIQDQFEELSIWTSNDTIIIAAKVITSNLRDFDYYNFEEFMYFKVSKNRLT